MQIIDEGHMSVLIAEGDIQGELVDGLEKALKGLIQENASRIALDMSQVGYIYSRGIGILIRVQKLLKSKGGALYLYNLKNSLQKILIGANLIEYLNAFGTREEVDFEISEMNLSKEDDSLELGLSCTVVKHSKTDALLRLEGTIDSEKDLQLLRKTCLEIITSGIVQLDMDVSDLIYMDDLAVLEMTEISKKLTSAGGKLNLKSPNEIIVDQLTIMGAKSYFEFVD